MSRGHGADPRLQQGVDCLHRGPCCGAGGLTLPLAGHLGLLVDSGWTPVESVDDPTLDAGAIPGRSPLVMAHPPVPLRATRDGGGAGYTGA